MYNDKQSCQNIRVELLLKIKYNYGVVNDGEK